MPAILTTTGAGWELRATTARVARKDLSYGLFLEIAVPGGSVSIRIGTMMTVDTGAARSEIHPADRPLDLPIPFEPEAGIQLILLRAHRSGRLEVHCEGILTTVEPHPDYEAWNLATSAKEMLVAMPGGEVAVWSATR